MIEFPGLRLLYEMAYCPGYRWKGDMLAEGREGCVQRNMLVTAWQTAAPAVEVVGLKA